MATTRERAKEEVRREQRDRVTMAVYVLGCAVASSLLLEGFCFYYRPGGKLSRWTPDFA